MPLLSKNCADWDALALHPDDVLASHRAQGNVMGVLIVLPFCRCSFRDYFKTRLSDFAESLIAGLSMSSGSTRTSSGRSKLPRTGRCRRRKDHHDTACHVWSLRCGAFSDQMRCVRPCMTARFRVTICVGRSPTRTNCAGSSRSRIRRSCGSPNMPNARLAPNIKGKSNILQDIGPTGSGSSSPQDLGHDIVSEIRFIAAGLSRNKRGGCSAQAEVGSWPPLTVRDSGQRLLFA